MEKTISLKTSLAHFLRIEFNQKLADYQKSKALGETRSLKHMSMPELPIHYDEKKLNTNIQKLCDIFVPVDGRIIGSDEDGSNIVHYAAEHNMHELLYLLNELGFHIDYINNLGMTPLSTAAFAGAYEACETLISLGINVNFIAPGSYGPLVGAVLNHQPQVVQLLKSHGADLHTLDSAGDNFAIYAARFGQLFELERLIDAGLSVNACNANKESLFWIAAQSNQIEVLKFLQRRGADIQMTSEEEGRRPLHIAAIHGHVEVIKTLALFKDDVNALGSLHESPLSYAIIYNKVEAVELLIKLQASTTQLTKHAYTALHTAAMKGNNEIITLLHKNGVDINLINPNGNTAFHIAALYNNIATLLLLQELGADIDAENQQGINAIDFAIENGATETIRVLKQMGVQKAQRFFEMFTPLDVYANNCKISAPEYIVDIFESLDKMLPYRALQKFFKLTADEAYDVTSQVIQYPALHETTLYDFALEKSMQSEYGTSTRRSFCTFLSHIYMANNDCRTLVYPTTTAALRVTLDFFQIEELDFITP